MSDLPVTALTLRRPVRDTVGHEVSVRYETVSEGLRCEIYPMGSRRVVTPSGARTIRRAVGLLPMAAQPEPGDRVITPEGTTYAVDDVISNDLGHRCDLREVR